MNETLNLQRFKTNKKLKDVADIKKWFPLQEYIQAPWKEPVFWYEQLVIRKFLLSFLDAPEQFSDQDKELAEFLIQEIKVAPFFNLTKYEKILRLGGEQLLFAKKRIQALSFGVGVKEMTVQDALKLLKNPAQPRKMKASRFLEPAVRYVPAYKKHLLPVIVNLNLPDDLLQEDFKKFITQKRKEECFENSKARNTVLGNWNANAILPYIDLVIWGTHNQTCISWPDFGEILFNDHTRDVRKITYETACYAMSEIALELLFYSGINTEAKAA